MRVLIGMLCYVAALHDFSDSGSMRDEERNPQQEVAELKQHIAELQGKLNEEVVPELATLKLSELRQRALDDDCHADKVDQAVNSDNPREALAELIHAQVSMASQPATPGSSSCTGDVVCPVGYTKYQTLLTGDPTTTQDASSKILTCYIGCMRCERGYFFDSSSSTCSICPAGKYSLSAGGEDASACIPCAAGTFSNQGAYECTPCPVDQYSSGTGNTACTQCTTADGTCNQCFHTTGACEQATCNDKFYESSGGTCSDCDPSCQTCEGPSNNQCTSCPAGAGTLNSAGICVSWVCPTCPTACGQQATTPSAICQEDLTDNAATGCSGTQSCSCSATAACGCSCTSLRWDGGGWSHRNVGWYKRVSWRRYGSGSNAYYCANSHRCMEKKGGMWRFTHGVQSHRRRSTYGNLGTGSCPRHNSCSSR